MGTGVLARVGQHAAVDTATGRRYHPHMNGLYRWLIFLCLVSAFQYPASAQNCGSEAIEKEAEALSGQSVEAMKQRAESGDTHAQAVIGHYFIAKRDYAQGVKWLDKAAAQNDADAQFMLAGGYKMGWYGLTADDAKAIALTKRAAEQGHCVAQLNLGSAYQLGMGGIAKDSVKAAEWFRKSAEQGFPPAELMLGMAYYRGDGMHKDEALAEFWVRKAANHGISPAQVMLAQMQQQGSEQVPTNPAEAETLNKLAAEQGSAPAQFKLGVLYRKGLAGPPDPVRAAQWFEKALNQGFTPAAYELGTMSEVGEGVPQSDEKAFQLYLVAAELGVSRAQVKAAQMLHVGRGTALDLIASYKWLDIATRLDNTEAKSLLTVLAREMKQEQIARAKALAEDWAADNADVIETKGYQFHEKFEVPPAKSE
ncbi:MAG: sel1 repeat family protein [Acidobacteriia bacterium]|nr:sel1 repeat family protein [Terriglobia bacterium]